MTHDPVPAVSVVVVSFDGRRHLEGCLPALLASRDAAVDVVVVDNASTDGSQGWLAERFPQVRVLALDRNRGFGEACRRGVAEARAPYVAFLNNDTVVDPGWLGPLVATLEAEREVAAACATLRLLDHPEAVNARGGGMTWLGYGFDRDLMLPCDQDVHGAPARGAVDVMFPTAAAMLMRKDDFVSCGGFDPAFFMYHEDVDLGWRLWLMGRRVVWCPEAVVYHRRGGTSAVLDRGLRDRLGARHNLRALVKNYHPVNAARAIAAILTRFVHHRAFGTLLDVLAWNLLHLPGTLAWRLWVQSRRARSDGEIFGRGLISEAPVPPPFPEAPRADPRAASWIPSPVLRPGEDSALGRLGCGWYAPESVEGRRARWTCGLGRCFLQVPPGATGRLVVEIAGSPGATQAVRIRCNGDQAEGRAGGKGWRALAVGARADPDGRLAVDVESLSWVPHAELGNGDFRRLGCAVSELRFEPDTPREPWLPHQVSVVIPTFNRRGILDETLRALEDQTWRNLQVIVVDDGSSDGTWEWLLQRREERQGTLELIALRQENAGPGRARNHGLRHAAGDLVLFLGDDILPDPECVARHVARHEQTAQPCAVVGWIDWDRARMRVTPLLEYVNLNGQQFGFGLLRDGEDAPFSCFYTSNVSLPREVLGDDPFHEAIPSVGWEDTELGYRLSLRGLRILYDRQASARHWHPTSLASFFRRQRRVGAAIEALLAVHPELEARLVVPPPGIVGGRVGLVRPVEWLLPLLNWLDRRGVRLPARMYGGLLQCAFHLGRAQSRETKAPQST